MTRAARLRTSGLLGSGPPKTASSSSARSPIERGAGWGEPWTASACRRRMDSGAHPQNGSGSFRRPIGGPLWGGPKSRARVPRNVVPKAVQRARTPNQTCQRRRGLRCVVGLRPARHLGAGGSISDPNPSPQSSFRSNRVDGAIDPWPSLTQMSVCTSTTTLRVRKVGEGGAQARTQAGPRQVLRGYGWDRPGHRPRRTLVRRFVERP